MQQVFTALFGEPVRERNVGILRRGCGFWSRAGSGGLGRWGLCFFLLTIAVAFTMLAIIKLGLFVQRFINGPIAIVFAIPFVAI